MSILAVDIGRGTQDILVWDPGVEPENAIQIILPSRTTLLAGSIDEAARLGRRVVLHGVTMGGGPITRSARRFIAAGGELLATPPAAATFSDDPDELREMGVTLIATEDAARLAAAPGALGLATADVDLPGLRQGLEALGRPLDLDGAAIAVQDHGAAPPGMSDRRFRFEYLRERLAGEPRLTAQGHTRASLPARFTRMRGVFASLEGIPRVMAMDTGFAALLGTLADTPAVRHGHRLAVNAGNGHTLAALLEGERVRSLVEHHSRLLDPAALGSLLEDLADGTVSDSAVFEAGGHGAWKDDDPFPGPAGIRRSITGPQRRRFTGADPELEQAAPFGSMMLTGCFGLLAAFARLFPGTGAEAFSGPAGAR
jgi:uncharacterized protein (DUF1786 family)